MVQKKHSRHVRASHKPVRLKRHHSRPFRKRHIALLLIAITALVVLVSVIISYRDNVLMGAASSRSFVGDLFSSNKKYETAVSSSYGFSLSYDQKKFYASGISNTTGDLYLGSELSTERAYSVVRIAPTFTSGLSNVAGNSAMTMTYHPEKVSAKDSPEAVALKDGGLDISTLTKVSTAVTNVGDQSFQMTTWQSQSTNMLDDSLSARFVTYAGTVKGNIVTIVISLGVGKDTAAAYEAILESISFDTKLGAVSTPTDAVVSKVAANRSLLDLVTNTQQASAATKADLTGSEKVAALYGPAVVKLYNTYCMDILIDGKPYLSNACGAASGSAFFVSQDGYLGTNGHVASAKPLDLIIEDAITVYSTKGDPKYFNYLLSLTALKASDIPATATTREKVGIMVDAMYTIDESRLTVRNDVQNLLVQVTPKNPDITALLQDTKDRKKYKGDASVLTATLEASDYRSNDGYGGFKSSDVAIIKVDGINFPIVKLGNIDTAVQGSNLSILGYPGNASDNGIVNSDSSVATLTTGKVSSKKNASNSDKKLIETDTTIGHGNSGGPALTDDGEVVGIATYTADGSGEGDGVYSYIRDIKDLTDLALDEDIIFDTDSVTQTEWEKGIANFYTSHYSKALQNFQKVKDMYPNNSRVAEFIAASEKRIANGEDVVDFPTVPVVIASIIVLAGIGVALGLIIRHHKKHKIYKAGVAQGSVLPVGAASGQQTVFVSQNGMRVDSPLPTTIAPAPAAPVQPAESTPPIDTPAPTPASDEMPAEQPPADEPPKQS